MALIKCNECNNEVSDKATSCPKCGAPIASNESIAAGATLKTVQETSKKFKLQSLISVSLIIIGFVWFIVSNSPENGQEPSGAAISMVLIGMIWYIVNRFSLVAP